MLKIYSYAGSVALLALPRNIVHKHNFNLYGGSRED